MEKDILIATLYLHCDKRAFFREPSEKASINNLIDPSHVRISALVALCLADGSGFAFCRRLLGLGHPHRAAVGGLCSLYCVLGAFGVFLGRRVVKLRILAIKNHAAADNLNHL